MRSSIVKLAAASSKLKNDENSNHFASDSLKYSVPSLLGAGLLGAAAMRHFAETDEDLRGSQLRGLGHGFAGGVALGGLAGIGAYKARLGLPNVARSAFLGTGVGVGLGNAYLNKKIREERARKKGR